MSNRLSKATKETILRAVMKKTMWNRFKVLLEEREALTEKARTFALKGREKEAQAAIDRIEKAEDVLKDILGRDVYVSYSGLKGDDLSMNIRGMHIRRFFYSGFEFKGFSFDELTFTENFSHERRITPNTWNNKVVITDEALCDAIMANGEAIDKFKEEVQQVAGTIRGILNNCTTVKKLREAWPECEEYLPEGIDDPKRQVSMNLPISVTALNETLTKYKAA